MGVKSTKSLIIIDHFLAAPSGFSIFGSGSIIPPLVLQNNKHSEMTIQASPNGAEGGFLDECLL